MPPINKELLRKIGKKLDVSERRAYDLVAEKTRTTHLPRHLAAVALAADAGINISKRAYATDEERDKIRAASRSADYGPATVVAPPSPATPARPARRAIWEPRRQAPPRKSNSVMVVHGRNLDVRNAVYAILRALSLDPIEFSQGVKATKKGAPVIGEVLDEMFRAAAAVVVLLTPDDEARLKTGFWKPGDGQHERKLTGQARANVLFEAGRAFGSHPDRTILVQVGAHRPFSDASGIHVVHLGDDAGSRIDLANRLENAGCAVDRSGTDWTTIAVPRPGGARKRRRPRR